MSSLEKCDDGALECVVDRSEKKIKMYFGICVSTSMIAFLKVGIGQVQNGRLHLHKLKNLAKDHLAVKTHRQQLLKLPNK